ncbi:hypothetical protein JW964_17395, partial [candidate division KSB1 bacterium]|nr:hypothetical protein [candidate division KSB1 bacterium]
FAGLQLNMIPVGAFTPESVLHLYQNSGFGTALFVYIISLIFFPPALFGFFRYLRNEVKLFPHIGFIYGGIAFIIFLITGFLQAGLVQLLAFQTETAGFTMKNDIFLINQIIKFLNVPNIIPYFIFLFFWGIAFKRLEINYGLIIGLLFLVSGAVLLLKQFSVFLEWPNMASVFYIIEVITLSVAFILAGTTVFHLANKLAS